MKNLKSVYAIQPYKVGTKNANTLAIAIPSAVARHYKLDSSTIFALKVDDIKKTITLQSVYGFQENYDHEDVENE